MARTLSSVIVSRNLHTVREIINIHNSMKEVNLVNKSQLVKSVADKSGLTQKDVDKALNSLIETITEALSSGEKVQLVGFGTFETRERGARTGRNPRTGEEIDIPARVVPAFKPGKALKDAVNNQ